VSTAQFPIDYSNCMFAGSLYTGMTDGIFAGTSAESCMQWDFTTHGTALTMRIWLLASGPTWEASIDGGGFAALTLPPTGSWADMVVFAGLADAGHTVVIRRSDMTGRELYFYHDMVSGFGVTGSAPAISAPAIGTQYLLFSSPKFRGNADVGGLTDWLFGPGFATSSFGFGPAINLPQNGSDARVTFRAKTSAISVYGSNWLQSLVLLIDGVQQAPVAANNDQFLFGWTTIAVGLDDSATHEYQIVWSDYSKTNFGQMAVGLSTPGLQPYSYFPKGKLWGFGDSIMAAEISNSAATGNSANSFFGKIANLTNRTAIAHAVPGKALCYLSAVASGALAWFDQISAYGVSDNDVGIILLGRNDLSGNGTYVTSTIFGQTYRLALQKLLSTNISKVIAVGVLNYTGDGADRIAYNAAMAAAVAAVADPRFVYFNSDGVIDPAVDTTDGTHLTVGGQDKLVTALQGSAEAVPVYVAPGSGTIPSASDVRFGVPVGTTTGTCHVPGANSVLFSIPIDSTTGNIVLPIAGVVEVGVHFGSSSSTVGTYDPVTGRFTDPGTQNVKLDRTYLFSGTLLTGTFSCPGGTPALLGGMGPTPLNSLLEEVAEVSSALRKRQLSVTTRRE
jgi:lysophospholipase L1-like esterase